MYTDGSLGAVVGVFFDTVLCNNEKNEDCDVHNTFIESLRFADATPEGLILGDVDFLDSINSLDLSKYWSFDGSLTTPPCTEGIKWNVIDDVQPISK